MEDDSPQNLGVEVAHPRGSPGSLSHQGEGLGKNRLEVLLDADLSLLRRWRLPLQFVDLLTEEEGSVFQPFVTQGDDAGFELCDPCD